MLEGGALTGKYLDESDEPRRYDGVGPKANALAREVIAVADELGVTPAQVAIAWVRAQPWHTVPIVGARTESQLRENLGALEVELEREQLERLVRRASSKPGSRGTSSSRSTSAGSSSATRSSSSTIRARLRRGSARRCALKR